MNPKVTNNTGAGTGANDNTQSENPNPTVSAFEFPDGSTKVMRIPHANRYSDEWRNLLDNRDAEEVDHLVKKAFEEHDLAACYTILTEINNAIIKKNIEIGIPRDHRKYGVIEDQQFYVKQLHELDAKLREGEDPKKALNEINENVRSFNNKEGLPPNWQFKPSSCDPIVQELQLNKETINFPKQEKDDDSNDEDFSEIQMQVDKDVTSVAQPSGKSSGSSSKDSSSKGSSSKGSSSKNGGSKAGGSKGKNPINKGKKKQEFLQDEAELQDDDELQNDDEMQNEDEDSSDDFDELLRNSGANQKTYNLEDNVEDIDELVLRAEQQWVLHENFNVVCWWKKGTGAQIIVRYGTDPYIYRIRAGRSHHWDSKKCPQVIGSNAGENVTNTPNGNVILTSRGDCKKYEDIPEGFNYTWKYTRKDVQGILGVAWKVPDDDEDIDTHDALCLIIPEKGVCYPQTRVLVKWKDGIVTVEDRATIRRITEKRPIDGDMVIYWKAKQSEIRFRKEEGLPYENLLNGEPTPAAEPEPMDSGIRVPQPSSRANTVFPTPTPQRPRRDVKATPVPVNQQPDSQEDVMSLLLKLQQQIAEIKLDRVQSHPPAYSPPPAYAGHSVKSTRRTPGRKFKGMHN
ncbi:uncharacterized protein BP01DRAFT_408517 [Aspergillus saccharolyticus JOP 1030-1]|uniref:Uncharacterized protein n=1 Tax=Aspergillus saccharolyticus JOP 1030-1 TaxID=1450539 RepID=A0A318Z114_9EURO|nr:hypothetical protein BP01DRAFT_408517 [Aspergillus saccharolyticus JOP 1030-1]PYH40991.1 hypothetical protein BP01DRAFT_408517 [Aspergillus saccharolyticus JOP 1030-1]